MQQGRRGSIDVLAVGELLIDFISTDYADSLFAVKQFEKLQGGSPANLSLNLNRLGNKVALVASIGHDAMGDFLLKSVTEAGLDPSYIARVNQPTTLVLVTRSREVSAFEAYRSADCQLEVEHLPLDVFNEVSIFHTTCFALSRKPAQKTIIQAAQLAAQQGCQLSIDANYAAKIWPNSEEARQIVSNYCALGALVKVSDVDYERLFARPLSNVEKAAAEILALGASLACVTLGEKGVYVATRDEGHFLPSRPIEVKDTTGAGDAFWSGFLTAYLDEHNLLNCAKAGRKMAEIKLQHFGPLEGEIDRAKIYIDI